VGVAKCQPVQQQDRSIFSGIDFSIFWVAVFRKKFSFFFLEIFCI
jgi:hypothetical protein